MQSYVFVAVNGVIQCVKPELGDELMSQGGVESDPTAFADQLLRPYMPKDVEMPADVTGDGSNNEGEQEKKPEEADAAC